MNDKKIDPEDAACYANAMASEGPARHSSTSLHVALEASIYMYILIRSAPLIQIQYHEFVHEINTDLNRRTFVHY